MKAIFGGLLEFENDEELIKYANNLSKHEINTLFETLVSFNQQNGALNNTESYLCFHMLKTLRDEG